MQLKIIRKFGNDIKHREVIKKLARSIWIYPLFLIIVFIFATALKVNGSSVGIYHQFLYGVKAQDPNLLYGSPKQVRADEWQDGTQFIIAQSHNNYQKFNTNIGTGRNLALHAEVPYKDWSAIFRPHTWGFFFLSFENAFSFKWWYPLTLLLITSYFFALRILRGKKYSAILFSLAVGLSPFLLWWYQTTAEATMGYAFLILILVHKIFQNEKFKKINNKYITKLIYTGLLFFILCCFELLFYPPFQISLALVISFYTIGCILTLLFTEKMKLKPVLIRITPVITAIVIAGLIGIIFVASNREPIRALSSTLYPGKRLVHSGGLEPLHILNGFLMPFQQNGAKLFRNLSESSNFILLLPFLLLPGFFLILWEYKKKQEIDWIFLSIQVCASLFLLRVFVPFGDPLYKLLLLDKVPHVRLLIGMGFVGFLQLLYILRNAQYVEFQKKYRNLLPVCVSILSMILLVLISLHIRGKQFNNIFSLLFFAVFFASIILASLTRRTFVALLILFLFSAVSSFRIMPLYKGLGSIKDTELTRQIQTLSTPGARWATLDDIRFENIGLVAGRKNLSGAEVYPDVNFWKQVGGEDNEYIYNREGHIMFTTNISSDMYLVKTNLFYVKFQCSQFILRNLDYVVADAKLDLKCVTLQKTVVYPKKTFYLYRIKAT